MCLRLYDYQSKASRYNSGLTYLKNRVTTNQKHTIDSQKPKRREHKQNTKENHQTTKGKTKRKLQTTFQVMTKEDEIETSETHT